MSNFTPILRFLGILMFAVFTFFNGNTQTGILNPADPIVVYNPSAPPAIPAFGTMAKWVKTNRLNWNTSSFKAYYYKGVSFRLKFPKSYVHGVADGKTYPIFVFYHGIGERGSIYDNEYQLYHGGQTHSNAVDAGKFDGFLLYIQSATSKGSFGDSYYDIVKEIIEKYLVPQVKGDINRVLVDGLSAGGSSVWDFTIKYPKLVAASLPISAVSISFSSSANALKYVPIWHFQGGLDNNPTPGSSRQVGNAILAVGGNYRYKEYPTQGHGCWNSAWAESDYFPYLNRAHKANPWPLSGRSEFCPGDPIQATLGVTAGFDGYEWRKDGVLINGAISNEIVVNTVGVYDCRIKRGTIWSPWSPIPVTIKVKGATIPPVISVSGLMSKVIPAPDGNNGVDIEVPEGYATYLWNRVGNTTNIGTTNVLQVTAAGEYTVKVTEQFGCSSEFSAPFTVVDANGPNKPDAAINLSASTLSKTSLRLDWSDNPTPQHNETNFEVYQASQPGGPYKLIAITGSDVVTQNATGLDANTKYYFKVRAVNATGASSLTSEASGTTAADISAPTAPSSLTIASTSRNSIGLQWVPATDDVGVVKYDIFIDGVKSFVTTENQFVLYNLETAKSYNFTIKARDLAGNISPSSNQVTGQPLLSGLNYKYYTFTGTWNNLPNFSTLTPVATGIMPNVAITNRTQNDNFAFLWEGVITIPTAGVYTFRTNSDDGSRLYLGALNQTASPYSFTATPLVNNDGLHGSQNRDGTITLAAGVYPIAITFYEQGGGESMTVTWKTPSSGTSFITIPNSAFADAPVINGVAPTPPSNLYATALTYDAIVLNWTDNSNNETAFEIWRSLSPAGPFNTVGITAANATTYKDSALDASTRFYYKIRALGEYGESELVNNFAEANWKLNNNYTDFTGNGRILTANSSPVFDAVDKAEGSHSVKLNGTSQSINISNSGSFLQEAYTERTIAFWMKAATTSNTNRLIFDIGGSDNGIAMRLNSGSLILGIASASVRVNVTYPYTSTSWDHIAVVYKQNSLKLFINGVEVAANNALTFTSIRTTTNAARIGATNGTNAFNLTTTLFSGWIDDFGIYNSSLTTDVINDLKNNSFKSSNATTTAKPGSPVAPSNFLAQAINQSSVQLSWNDNATNESGFEIFRSANNNTNYVLLKLLTANSTSYIDTALFANAIYYYKVRAINVGGNSANSTEDSAKTTNNKPELSGIDNQYIRFDQQKQINLTATDKDAEQLSFQVTNLPSFASFVPGTNGNALINIVPALSDIGTYNNIQIVVTDQNGGTSEKSFNLVINDNYTPTINPVSNISLNEKATAQANITATDQNAADVLTWTFNGLPSFVTTVSTAGNIQLNLAPGYADGGTYQVWAKVNDGNFGTDSIPFQITVGNVNPNKKVFVNFNSGNNAISPWNNTNKVPALNDIFPSLLDETGANSGLGLQIMTSWQSVGTGSNALGVSTGNNSGVYPDAVMSSAYWSNTTKQTIKIFGLDVNSKYNFTFFGSRANVTDDRTSVYTINGQNVSLNAAGNRSNTVSLNGMVPLADGSLLLDLKNATTSAFSYLNAMVIENIYDDQTSPAKVRNLSAQLAENKINLTWIDAAYNENNYEVYRATNPAGPFDLLSNGTLAKDATLLSDNLIEGNQTYFYFVKGINSYGTSNSDIISISTPNTAPVLTSISNVSMKNDDLIQINIVASDEAGDVITLSSLGLPGFASLVDNGNGTGVLSLSPGINDLGTYTNLQIKAIDNLGAYSTVAFNVIVTNKDITSVYVNFNQLTPVGNPWNSFNNLPLAGTTVSALKDEANNITPINITLVDGWEGPNELGAVTGNNTGVFPDNVMKTAYFESSTNAKRIRITGLATDRKYNLVFFASRAANDTRITNYSAGGKTASLNASGNTQNTAPLNGLSPDATGTIEVSVSKASTSSFAYINAMIIQSYLDNGLPLAPTNSVAKALTKNSISINWNDKSDNETGFEIYRSTSRNGVYTLAGTVNSNSTSFNDAGLQVNTSYYYKVRSVLNETTYSGYSNVASASTFAYLVSINFNRDNPAAAPWNNTNNVPQVGSVYANMLNELSNPTGINLEVMTDFSGENPFGVNTGNNSGVYPDNVMRSSWWLDVGVTSQIKISGLSQAQEYSFVFFGSRDGTGNRTTVYTINGQSVSLNCSGNSTQTVQLDKVRADENGEATITVSLAPGAIFGYLGALVIQASNIPPDEIENPTIGSSMVNANLNITNSTSPVTVVEQQQRAPAPVISKLIIKGYPNPFVDQLTLSANFEKAQSRVIVRIMDMAGRVVYSQEFQGIGKGPWVNRMNLSGKVSEPGVYLLQLSGPDMQKISTLQLIKLK